MKLQYKQVLLGAQRARAVRIVRRIMGECTLLWFSPSAPRAPPRSSVCYVHHHDGSDSLPLPYRYCQSLPGTADSQPTCSLR